MSDLFINVLLIIGLTNINTENAKVNSNHSYLLLLIVDYRGKNVELFLVFWYNTNTQHIGDKYYGQLLEIYLYTETRVRPRT